MTLYSKEYFRLYQNEILVYWIDWKKLVRESYKDLASYLNHDYPLNFVGKDFMVAGKNYLFWMLEQSKNPTNPDNRYEPIIAAIKSGLVCDIQIEDQDVIQKMCEMALVVFFSSDYSKHFSFLMEIMREVPEGEEFLQEEIVNKI